jgi:hypothetical protein
MGERLHVLTLWREGGPFHLSDVAAMRDAVARNLSDMRFACLSDRKLPGIETIRLAHDFPGLWARVELFRPAMLPWGARAVFLDPGVGIAGELAALARYGGRLAMLRDPVRASSWCSDAMAWRVGFGHGVYSRFAAHPRLAMRTPGGISGWIAEHVPGADRLQEAVPGLFESVSAGRRRDWVAGAMLPAAE